MNANTPASTCSDSNPKKWDVLGFGAIAVDDLIYVAAYPAPDSKARVLARERHGGGLCATALCAAAKLGASTAFAGVLGRDELSRFSRRELQIFGVDTSQILTKENARPHHSSIVVARKSQSRTIFSYAQGVTPFPSEAMTPQLLQAARVIFLDHTLGAGGQKITALAAELGIACIADIERTSPLVESWLSRVDHLIIGESFACQLTACDDAKTAVARLGEARAAAIVTRGENGCLACGVESGLQILERPAFKVQIADTTGCGDVFHGAYAAELARGSDLETRLQIASAAAAIKAQFRGGRGGLPSREDVVAFLSRAGTVS